jgi:hypothetical protein
VIEGFADHSGVGASRRRWPQARSRPRHASRRGGGGTKRTRHRRGGTGQARGHEGTLTARVRIRRTFRVVDDRRRRPMLAVRQRQSPVREPRSSPPPVQRSKGLQRVRSARDACLIGRSRIARPAALRRVLRCIEGPPRLRGQGRGPSGPAGHGDRRSAGPRRAISTLSGPYLVHAVGESYGSDDASGSLGRLAGHGRRRSRTIRGPATPEGRGPGIPVVGKGR